MLTVGMLACTSGAVDRDLTAGEKDAIRLEIEQVMREAYDLSKPNAAERMIALYPKSGRIISANSGRASVSRDSLEAAIRYFWNNVGVNMRNPHWAWEQFYVDVLSPNAAVVTATYLIHHRNPQNQPHVLGGAMTAVFEKRDGRWVIVQEHLSDLPQSQDTTMANMPAHDRP